MVQRPPWPIARQSEPKFKSRDLWGLCHGLVKLLLLLFSTCLCIVQVCVFMYSVCVYVFVHTGAFALTMSQCICEDQMTTCGSQLTFSTLWVLWIEVRSSGFAASEPSPGSISSISKSGMEVTMWPKMTFNC